MAGGALPEARSLLLALLYSIGAHGIMTLNDFKAIEGDSRMGIRSLPVQLGADRAARVACWVMAVPQIIVVILLAQWGAPVSAVSVAVLIAAQAVLMRRLIAAPIQQALFYSGFGVPLYVSGMMVSAFALRGLG
jgi:chlorophyll synthase